MLIDIFQYDTASFIDIKKLRRIWAELHTAIYFYQDSRLETLV